MSFPHFCEAVVRLATLNVPRVPWGEKPVKVSCSPIPGTWAVHIAGLNLPGSAQVRDLRGRVEFFLTHSLFPVALAAESAPFDLQRAHRQAKERPRETVAELAALARSKKAVLVAQHAANTAAGSGR
jgi:hypothetical protein